MKLRVHTTIRASASEVWPYLVDPVLQAAWNPKVVSVDRPADGPVQAGERFLMIYRMSGKEKLSRVEVTGLVPNQSLVFEHHMDEDGKARTAIEAYTLTPTPNGVKLTQSIDLSRMNIPLPIRVLVWLITRLGKPVERPYLDRLKQMIESDRVYPNRPWM